MWGINLKIDNAHAVSELMSPIPDDNALGNNSQAVSELMSANSPDIHLSLLYMVLMN